MRDIGLKITGNQTFGGGEAEQVEFFSEGKIYSDEGVVYIIYEEGQGSGLDECQTVLKIEGESVTLRREEGGNVQTEMFFELGQRFNGKYETPFGIFDVEVLTSRVENHIDADTGTGQIDIEYEICLEGIAEGRNSLTIAVV